METVIKVQKTSSIKKRLEDIILDISWAKIGRRYFGKSPSWMYHKLDERDSNGGTGGFSEEEKEQFKGALYDLSERIRRAADTI